MSVAQPRKAAFGVAETGAEVARDVARRAEGRAAVDVLQCGLTEADLLQGYGKPAAYCGSGCSAPPVLRVTESEWLCQACADAMQVGGGAV
jgi:hypothetical protein